MPRADVAGAVGPHLATIRAGDLDERFDALQDLSELIEDAYGDDGAATGRELRAQGGVNVLATLLMEPYPEMQACVLQTLGNVCSDSVDPKSHETKSLLVAAGGDQVIFECLLSDDESVLFMACAVLQNLCNEPEWSQIVVQQRAYIGLEALLVHPEERVQRYSAGALRNLISSQRLIDAKLPELSDEAYEAIHRREIEAAIQMIRS